MSSGNAVTIGYGTSERAADRLVDPYALVLHRDHMYLHAWCRTAEERYYAARGEEVPAQVPEAFAHAATGEAANSADSEAGEKEPTFWRNFRLTRINHIQEAGAGRTHPVTGDTVPNWHAQQHSTQTNPFAELRIHPTEHIPSGEPLDTLTATYMRRSTHHVKKASRDPVRAHPRTTTTPTALAIRTSSTPSSHTEVPSNWSALRTCARRCLTSCKPSTRVAAGVRPQVCPQKNRTPPTSKNTLKTLPRRQNINLKLV